MRKQKGENIFVYCCEVQWIMLLYVLFLLFMGIVSFGT